MNTTIDNTVCGGCGNSDPDKRCLGCLHPFPQEEKKMDLSDLFPNSPQNAFEQILKNKHNFSQVKIVRDALKEHTFNNSPIMICTEIISKPGEARRYTTQIKRGENQIRLGEKYIRGIIDFQTATWKHVLLGHDKPNIKDFDLAPKTGDCVACGKPDSPRDLGSGGPYRCRSCLVY